MRDLYQVLGISRDATASVVKKAYLSRARDTHPDKHGDDPQAKERFQELGRAYAVLRDDARRKLYDETGMLDEDGAVNRDGTPWDAFWRDFYSSVTCEKLNALEAQYKGSEEELEDLKQAYLSSKGDMDRIMDTMMLCTAQDEPRFRQALEDLISRRELREFRAFKYESATKQQRRSKKASREAKEAEAHAKELGLRVGGGASSGDDPLRSALAVRAAERATGFDAMLASLEGRYGSGQGSKAGKGARTGKAAPLDDPLSDEAFAAAQQRMMKRRR